MKKWRNYLALLLLCVLTVSLLPAQALAAVAEGAYTVLVESAIDVYQLGDPYGDVNVIDGTRVVKYDGSGIQTVNLSVSVSDEVYGFSPSGYARVNPYSNATIIDSTGKAVYQLSEGESVANLSDDGYLIISSYDGQTSTSTYAVVDLKTGQKYQQAGWVYRDGAGKTLEGYSDGMLLVWEVRQDTQSGGYTYSHHYEDLNGNVVLSENIAYAYAFQNGYAVVERSINNQYYRELIDKTGRVVLSDQDTGLTLQAMGSDGMVSLWDSDYNRAYAKLSEGLNNPLSARFENGRDFANGFAVVWDSNGAVGLIDTTGSTVIPFGRYQNLSDVSGTGLVWAVDQNSRLCVLKVTNAAPEYIYDIEDPGADLVLPAEKLENVETRAQAVRAVKNLTDSMTQTQKAAPTGIDLATLYAETAAAKVSTKKVTKNELLINAAAIKDLQDVAKQTTEAVESTLVSGGVTTARYLAKTATLSTSATGKITFRVDPDVLTVDVDKIRVETPDYAITLDLDELEPDLTGVLTFTAEAKEDASAVKQATADAGVYAAAYKNTAVEVALPNGKVSNSVTLSMPTDSGDQTYKAVVKTTGETTTSKYNPATTNIDGKINSSGTYKVTTNEVNFTDISGKSAEMQQAIRYLASKGVINGTTETTFSPNNSISRAEIAALLVRSLGWNNSAAVAGFTDVTAGDWFYSAAASSQAHNLINGFGDGTFKGRTNIAKDQLIVVSSRVLKEKMGYMEPADTASYLANYADSVAVWAQGGVALATRENLVVPRIDGTFKGAGSMTRGDAAIIIYRLFQKIW